MIKEKIESFKTVYNYSVYFDDLTTIFRLTTFIIKGVNAMILLEIFDANNLKSFLDLLNNFDFIE